MSAPGSFQPVPRPIGAGPTHGESPESLIARTREGDSEAAAELFRLLYDSLRMTAESQLRGERLDHTLQPTALVHEVYVKIVGGQSPGMFQDSSHFFASAVTSMRHILVDHARAKRRIKRGGGQGKLSLEHDAWERIADPMDLVTRADPEMVLSLNGAIRRLEEEDPEVGGVVRLRFFAGLTETQTAQVLGVSDRTVRRQWAYARGWLLDALRSEAATDSGTRESEFPLSNNPGQA